MEAPELIRYDENSPIPLTSRFQLVQFNKGEVRKAIDALRRCTRLHLGPSVSSKQWMVRAERDGHQRGAAMLVLSRKKNESIIINDNITVTVIEIRGDKVRLGIEAPKDVTVHRREVYEAIQNQSRTREPGTKVRRPTPDRPGHPSSILSSRFKDARGPGIADRRSSMSRARHAGPTA